MNMSSHFVLSYSNQIGLGSCDSNEPAQEFPMSIQITAPAPYVPQSAVAFAGADGATLVSASTPLPTSEPAYATASAITPDTPFAAPRAIAVVAQGAGNVAFRFANANTLTVPVAAGLTILPFAATQVLAAGTTAAAACYALA
jgi:hypothetical protein